MTREVRIIVLIILLVQTTGCGKEDYYIEVSTDCYLQECTGIAVDTYHMWPYDYDYMLSQYAPYHQPSLSLDEQCLLNDVFESFFYYNYNADSLFISFCCANNPSAKSYLNPSYGRSAAVSNAHGILSDKEDGIIVSQLMDYIKRISPPISINSSSELRYGPIPYSASGQYRLEELEDIQIIADKQLFALPAGSSLNDYFHVFSAGGGGSKNTYVPFFFTYDKELVPFTKLDKTIEEFLAYRPLAPAVTALRLIETPPEAPLDVKFTVTVTIKDKAPMSDTTRTITLL